MLLFKIDEDKYSALQDESIKNEYSQGADGQYYLDVDGVVSKDKLKEFRDNNISLQKQLDVFKGLTPDDIKVMKKAQRDLENAKLWDEGEVDKVVNDRTQAMRSDYETKISEYENRVGSLNGKLEGLLIDGDVRSVATQEGIRKTAFEDLLLRARTTFKLKDGKPTPFDQDGQPIYGKDGSNVMSIGEWVQGLRKIAPHLFEESSGGDTRPTGSRSKADAGNMTTLQKIQAGIGA